MSVSSIDEIFEGAAGRDKDNARTYSRSWRVLLTTPTDSPAIARDACPVARGAAYSVSGFADGGSWVQDIQARPDPQADDHKTWIVTATYGPVEPQSDSDPTTRDLQISWESVKFEKIFDFDINGQPIVNRAADPFDPPVTGDRSRPILKIVRCEKPIDPSLITLYRDAINSDVFLGADPYTVKVQNITAVLKKDPDVEWYWEVSYEFEYDPDGWRKKVLNQGYRYLTGSAPNRKRKPILVDGAPATSPVLLTSTGGVLSPDGTPTFIEFKIYPELPFAVFNFTLGDIPAIVI